MSAQRRLVYAYTPEGDAWGPMIGLAKGFDSERAAFDWCHSHAVQRGKQSAVVCREKHGGSVVQIGHVGEAHRREGGSYQPNARGGELDEQAARELEIYIENEYSLVGAPNSQGKSIEKNLETKIKQGKFDLEKSVKLWGYLIESGAKKYAKEFSVGTDWHQMFSPATRKFVAQRFADHFASERGLKKNGGPSRPKGGSGARPPRFKLAAPVRVMHTDVEGPITYVGAYDEHLGQYRYKVRGSNKYWNEDSLIQTGGFGEHARPASAERSDINFGGRLPPRAVSGQGAGIRPYTAGAGRSRK